MAIRILLVDDHVIVREGIRCLLEMEMGMRVVGEASNGRAAVAAIDEMPIDVVLMDVAMPVLNGIDATRQIKDLKPALPVLGLSLHSDRHMVGQMLRAGASGYVLKEADVQELGHAIRTVEAGGTYLSAAVAGVVVSHFVRGDGEESGSAFDSLTPREREVLQLLAEGHATRQIADKLCISIKTIDTHRYQIMRKLKFRGLADLTRYALREGLSTLDV